MRKVILQALMIMMIMFGGVIVAGESTQAAHAPYETTIISQTGNGSLVVEPGSVTPVEVQFLNEGSVVWGNDGPGYVSLYTFEPRYRSSKFDPGTWLGPAQVKRIKQEEVAPGERGSMIFELRAPEEEGVYKEVFHLASEDRAWVEGGQVVFNIEVREASTAQEAPVTEVTPVAPTIPISGSSAAITAQTVSEIEAEPGSGKNIQFAIQNTGKNTWGSVGLRPSEEMGEMLTLQLQDESWGRTLAAERQGSVEPGQVVPLGVTLTSPIVNGVHKAQFEVIADGASRTGTMAEITFIITDGVAEEYVQVEDFVSHTYEEEPILRIGLLTIDEETDNKAVITGVTSGYQIETRSGSQLAARAMGQSATTWFDGASYWLEVDGVQTKHAEAIRFIPPQPEDILEISNFDRRETRNAVFADNQFRGTLEIRHNAARDRVWLINEIPMELYLRGLNETHNLSPYEFQEAKIMAARSFAYYHWLRADKWDQEHFTMTSYSYDQVYSGYGKEERSPVIVQAVEATAGKVITYAGEVIMAPYFTQSDGRTRNWSDVWNGSRPWAVSVEVPCDAGKRMLGHGIGMSGQAGICMANQGMTAEEILKHFYTGVDIEKRWK